MAQRYQRRIFSEKKYEWDVFICYSSHDKKKVRQLAYQLQYAGIRVWLDEEQISPGENVLTRIEDDLDECRWVIVTLSHNLIECLRRERKARKNPQLKLPLCWPRLEYSAILQREIEQSETRVIPVLLDPLEPEELPTVLNTRNRVDLYSRNSEERIVHFRNLVRTIKPLHIDQYIQWAKEQQVVSTHFNREQKVETNDLLPLDFRLRLYSYDATLVRMSEKFSTRIERVVQEITKPERSGSHKVSILLGEAGVGKTTTCLWIRHYLANNYRNLGFIPFYLSLGQWDGKSIPLDTYNSQLRLHEFRELHDLAKHEGSQLLLLLDGWNEKDNSSRESVEILARSLVDNKEASVLITSRQVLDVASILSRQSEAKIFEIQRWNDQQLHTYFQKNNQLKLFKQIPDVVCSCLRLPLLASLIIRQLDTRDAPPSLRTIADVFEFVIKSLLEHEPKEKHASLQPYVTHRQIRSLRPHLEFLAYEMTKRKVTTTNGAQFQKALPTDMRMSFRPFFACLVNCGMLRCSNSAVALNPKAKTRDLRTLEFSFLHQSFQEYLAARYVLRTKSALPQDISQDAFWRDIPVYMIRSHRNPKPQDRFIHQFLTQKRPDYAIASRLACEIDDPALKKRLQAEIGQRLRNEMTSTILYSHSIEAFEYLGEIGLKLLHSNLRPRDLSTTYAQDESHLLGQSNLDADEGTWRLLGRSVYLLGELGDIQLSIKLSEHINKVVSIHLLYHIGEALLTLARVTAISKRDRKHLKAIAQALLEKKVMYEWMPRRLPDPVLRGYAIAVIRECGGSVNQNSRHATRLADFLISQSNTGRRHFQNEFWCRAHGCVALAEIASTNTCVDVLSRLFSVEDSANYGEFNQNEYPETINDFGIKSSQQISHGDYHPVQSALLKAVLRSCDRWGDYESWRPFIEEVYMSSRINTNRWACRHLERLLMKWFHDRTSLNWISQWSQSDELGGDNIQAVLKNVLWYYET
jgi:hypothetical protein